MYLLYVTLLTSKFPMINTCSVENIYVAQMWSILEQLVQRKLCERDEHPSV